MCCCRRCCFKFNFEMTERGESIQFIALINICSSFCFQIQLKIKWSAAQRSATQYYFIQVFRRWMLRNLLAILCMKQLNFQSRAATSTSTAAVGIRYSEIALKIARNEWIFKKQKRDMVDGKRNWPSAQVNWSHLLCVQLIWVQFSRTTSPYQSGHLITLAWVC